MAAGGSGPGGPGAREGGRTGGSDRGPWPPARLPATGGPVPELRAELRRTPHARDVLTVLGCYAQSFGVMAAAVAINRWWAWVLAFLLLGRAQALFAILAHEAAHRLLFTAKLVNDGVGR